MNIISHLLDWTDYIPDWRIPTQSYQSFLDLILPSFYFVPLAVKYNIKIVAQHFGKGLEPAWVYYYGMHWTRNSWQECKNKSLLILWDDFKQKSRKFFWKIPKPLVIVKYSFFPKENTKYISMLINHTLLHPLQLVFPNSKQPYKVNKNKKSII